MANLAQDDTNAPAGRRPIRSNKRHRAYETEDTWGTPWLKKAAKGGDAKGSGFGKGGKGKGHGKWGKGKGKGKGKGDGKTSDK